MGSITNGIHLSIGMTKRDERFQKLNELVQEERPAKDKKKTQNASKQF